VRLNLRHPFLNEPIRSDLMVNQASGPPKCRRWEWSDREWNKGEDQATPLSLSPGRFP
jgi:hypothetical protein